jgi:hypothetical protein
MAKIEMRVILQQRDLEDENPKWRNVNTSEAFGEFTLADYNGLAIDVVLEAYRGRIRSGIDGTYGT